MQERGEITSEMLEDADAVAGLSFTDEERELMLERLNRNQQAYLALRGRASRPSRRPSTITRPWRPRDPSGWIRYPSIFPPSFP